MLTLLIVAVAHSEGCTRVGHVGASVELLIARTLESSAQADKGVTLDLELAFGITRQGHRRSSASEVASEGLEVAGGGSTDEPEVLAVGADEDRASKGGSSEEGDQGELHLGCWIWKVGLVDKVSFRIVCTGIKSCKRVTRL